MVRSQKNGFTLIEILVVVSILAILVSVIVINFGEAREQARDAQRKTDLRTVEAALVLYKNKYGRYPEACNGPITTRDATVFSGQRGTDHECPEVGGVVSSQYIVDLAPEFIPKLPVDSKLNGENSGYVYLVNDEGSVYKFMALNTVETEEVRRGDQFSRCGENWSDFGGVFGASWEDARICRQTPNEPGGTQSGTTPLVVCGTEALSRHTYAVSAGYSNATLGATIPEKGREFDTEIVRCG